MKEVGELLQALLLSFIPLFVVVDAIGVLPFVIALTQDLEAKKKARSLRYGMLTALALGLGFIAIGKFVFAVLGISSQDFLVAGGLLLLALSLKDLITGKLLEYQMSVGEITVGIVPIGTPLVVGPGVLTTLLLLIDRYPYPIVLIAFALNLLFAWVVFAQGVRVSRFLGIGGQRAISKIASLLLAAIAVKMIRQGIAGFLAF